MLTFEQASCHASARIAARSRHPGVSGRVPTQLYHFSGVSQGQTEIVIPTATIRPLCRSPSTFGLTEHAGQRGIGKQVDLLAQQVRCDSLDEVAQLELL